jgi:alkylhydroperoxidase/carboxymuconolactone decarboxylase family protein YurZ
MAKTLTDGFDALLAGASARASSIDKGYFDAVAKYWATPLRPGALSQKQKDLVALAVHASPSMLNGPAIGLHVNRAREAGATDREIADVLITIAPLGSHTFAAAAPALLETLKELGREDEAKLPALTAEAQRIKDDFVARRGYWTENREMLAALVPEFFAAYMKLSTEPWRNGALEPKFRELLFVAIDCSITHTYEYGLRLHIRNALNLGATPEELLEVFEIAMSIGASTYAAGIIELVKLQPASNS